MSDSYDAWRSAPVAMGLATVGGLGHLPAAPGTFVRGLSGEPWSLRIGCFVVATLASMVVCHRAGRALDEPDSPHVVLDETIGLWATLVWCPHPTWSATLVGFVAFRFFDVFKGPLATRLHERHPDGFGVVGDDLVAALWSIPPTALAWWYL